MNLHRTTSDADNERSNKSSSSPTNSRQVQYGASTITMSMESGGGGERVSEEKKRKHKRFHRLFASVPLTELLVCSELSESYLTHPFINRIYVRMDIGPGRAGAGTFVCVA
jgi:hypothetical protein